MDTPEQIMHMRKSPPGPWPVSCVLFAITTLFHLPSSLARDVVEQPAPTPTYEFRFGNTQSNGMVLQGAPLASSVWGFVPHSSSFSPTTSGGVQVCRINDETKQSVCANAVLSAGPVPGAQIFTATLAPTEPSNTSYTITARPSPSPRAGSAPLEGYSTMAIPTISLTNVVFGDVYVCSGQSNMDVAAPMAFNATQESYDYPFIRTMTVQKCGGGGPHNCEDPGPLLEFQNASFVGQQWTEASHETIYGPSPLAWSKTEYANWESKIGQVVGGSGFSATCWFFGREMHARRQYPIGLIWSSIGGSSDTEWMPPAGEFDLRRAHRSPLSRLESPNPIIFYFVIAYY